MTEEEEKILFKDLCARLPYGVKCERYGKAYELVEIDIKRGLVYVLRDDWYTPTSLPYSIKRDDDIRPYLRPMSSMTEEEKEELKNKCVHNGTEEDWFGVRSVWGIEILYKYNTRQWDNSIEISRINMDAIDWLNSHHFDYRGLIEKGLALEAPKNMYEDLNNK